MSHRVAFTGALFRWDGPAAWHFVEVPADLAPPATHPWGRTPVTATVDGTTWPTSVWHGKDGRTFLAVPKKVRGAREAGSVVAVTLIFSGV